MFQMVPLSDAAKMLPLYADSVPASRPVADSTTESEKKSNLFPIMIAVGIIIALGGVFLSLAAHNFIPGFNAISDLGVWGEVLGYGVIGIGLIIAIVGGVKTYLTQKQEKEWEASQKAQTQQAIDMAKTEVKEQFGALDGIIPSLLKRGEIFTVYDELVKKVRVYYSDVKGSHVEEKEYNGSPVEISEWYTAISGNRKDIATSAMKERIAAFKEPEPFEITPEWEKVFNQLLEGWTTIDDVPQFADTLPAWPTENEMDWPIMKGFAMLEGKKIPIVAVKLACKTETDALRKIVRGDPSGGDRRILVFFSNGTKWFQRVTGAPDLYPIFFPELTSIDDSKSNLVEAGFKKLQYIINSKRAGPDSHFPTPINWELYDNSSDIWNLRK